MSAISLVEGVSDLHRELEIAEHKGLFQTKQFYDHHNIAKWCSR